MTVGHLARNDILHVNKPTRSGHWAAFQIPTSSNQPLIIIDFDHVIAGMC